MEDKKNVRASLQKITKTSQVDYAATCKAYAQFLSTSKTPTSCVASVVAMAKKHGFSQWSEKTKKADSFYITNEDGTNAAVVKIGSAPLEKGIHLIGAHVDTPCLTGKANPIREKPEGVVLDCYPYGGIYFHQWFDTSVVVVGHCVKQGKVIAFELPGVISDATIHLSNQDRSQKKYEEAFQAENLDVFIGYKDKKDFLAHMKKKHGLDERDFARTMLTVVPKSEPHTISDLYFTGFGQDDRVCSFAQLHALFRAKPKKTAIALFFDREEIGSTGYNGALSKFLERVLDAVMQAQGVAYSESQMRKLFANSQMISADVDVAYNSNDVPYSDEESASKFGDGLVMDRHNGGRNQGNGNNVPIYLVDKYMELFTKKDVPFKVSSIPPKVNVGGGGTISMYFAHRGLPVVDMGIAIINMHGKNSVIFLPDLYQMVRGFHAFFESDL